MNTKSAENVDRQPKKEQDDDPLNDFIIYVNTKSAGNVVRKPKEERDDSLNGSVIYVNTKQAGNVVRKPKKERAGSSLDDSVDYAGFSMNVPTHLNNMKADNYGECLIIFTEIILYIFMSSI